MRTIASLLLLATLALAGDVYYRVPVRDLEIVEGALPEPKHHYTGRMWRAHRELTLPTVALDGRGEAYLDLTEREPFARMAERGLYDFSVLVQVKEGAKPPSGVILLPKGDWSGMQAARFRLPEQAQPDASLRAAFLEARSRYYRWLLERGVPGAAWFRHRLAESGGGSEDLRRENLGLRDVGATFDLYSGGRALSENLQLDRQLPAADDGTPVVELASLQGVKTKEIDWKPYLKDAAVDKDPLASKIPADQYALLFPSFLAMVALSDEAEARGTPLLYLTDARAEDARTRARYELQLGVKQDALSRVFGPKLVKGVALTGSDPYFRTGTDVALLLETPVPAELYALIVARRAAMIEAAGVRFVRPDGDGNLLSPDRRVSSYLAKGEGFVVVANSRVQLDRVLATARGEAPALASSPEYAFFRQRYPRDDAEATALLIIADPAIRRWCSPRWRIGASRRLRAAAELAELTTRNLDAVVQGVGEERLLEAAQPGLELGKVTLGHAGVHSSIFNTANFLTPIAELEFDRVTREEARLYEAWRQGYENRWSNYFDPVAVRFATSPTGLSADVTVMPLIAGSDYRQLIQLVGNATLAAEAGDRHADSLLHFAMAIDPESQPVKSLGGFLFRYSDRAGAEPLGWLGSSLSIYVDDDPILDEMRRAEDLDAFLRSHGYRLPVALRCEVKSAVKLTLFLTALRAFADQAAPGMANWEVRKHREHEYVCITPTDQARRMEDSLDQLVISYVILENALVVSLNEDVVKRAIDRQLDGVAPAGAPWRGKHVCFQLDRKLLTSARSLLFDILELRQPLRERSWTNLYVLNEWKRLYPSRDPVELHQRLFGTRLICPGGGEYVWNEQWNTMESTVYGHPGAPKDGPELPPELDAFRSVNFGLTFENEGLRAVAELRR